MVSLDTSRPSNYRNVLEHVFRELLESGEKLEVGRASSDITTAGLFDIQQEMTEYLKQVLEQDETIPTEKLQDYFPPAQRSDYATDVNPRELLEQTAFTPVVGRRLLQNIYTGLQRSEWRDIQSLDYFLGLISNLLYGNFQRPAWLTRLNL